jgi:hypothetical protein
MRRALALAAMIVASGACSSRSSSKPPPAAAGSDASVAVDAPSIAPAAGPIHFLTRAHVPDGPFTAISTGGFFACVLDDQHRATCWRHDGRDAPVAPAESFTQIDVAESGEVACGVTMAGAIACWGSAAADIPAFGAGPWTQVSVALGYACAVARDGALSCRGQRVEVVAHVPAGTFRGVDASTYHACAVDISGAYQCWGGDGERVRVVTNATQVATSATHTAVLLGRGEIITWYVDDQYGAEVTLPAGPYVEVVAGNRIVCGRRANGAVSCDGWNGSGTVRAPTFSFQRISAGVLDACGITSSGAAVCWGEHYLGPLPSIVRGFALDRVAACWLDAAGTITCTGAWHEDAPAPPRGAFRALSLDGTDGCAIDVAGDVQCWGFRAPQFPPDKNFVSIDVGLNGACGLTRDGKAFCPSTDPLMPPELPGTWKSVSMGTAFACGITTAAEVGCYGDGNRGGGGVNGSPRQHYASIVAGYEHACAIVDDGTVACWGYDTAGETSPPAGLHATRLALSEKKSCALDTTGAIVCWGRQDGGTLPTGPFVDLFTSTSGEDDEPAPVCGLTASSELRCGFF